MKQTKKIFAIVLVILALLLTAKIAWGLSADNKIIANTNVLNTVVLSGVPDGANTIVSYTIATPPTNGVAAIPVGSNIVTYTPNPGFTGHDSFTYTITDSLNATATGTVTINGLPTATLQNVNTNEDTVKTITLTGNDPENLPLTYTLATQPSHGNAVLAGNIVTYTPSLNYFGLDSFTFTVADSYGITNTNSVNINVLSVNDLPAATAQSITTMMGTVATITLAGTDVEGINPNGYSIVTQPAHGTAVLAGNIVTYTPAAGYYGADSFTFQVTDTNGATATATVSITVQNHLKITNLKVNDKTSGKLKISSTNKVSATIGNDFDQTLEDVTVTIRILDVDGDDLEEEINSFTLNAGREKVVSAEFDLSSEVLDSDSYTVEIEAAATGKTDDKDYDNTERKDFDVERSSHAVIIKKAELSNDQMTCDRQTSLYVTVENIGKNSEDNVDITVKNSVLSLNKNKDNIELDDYSGTDTTYKATFALDLTGVKAGTYPLTVAVNLDGDLQETQDVSLVVGSCATAGSSSTQTNTYTGNTELSTYLQQQLQQRAEAEKQAALQPVVKSATVSFRDSTAYTAVLGTIVGLLIIAVILALAVLIF